MIGSVTEDNNFCMCGCGRPAEILIEENSIRFLYDNTYYLGYNVYYDTFAFENFENAEMSAKEYLKQVGIDFDYVFGSKEIKLAKDPACIERYYLDEKSAPISKRMGKAVLLFGITTCAWRLREISDLKKAIRSTEKFKDMASRDDILQKIKDKELQLFIRLKQQIPFGDHDFDSLTKNFDQGLALIFPMIDANPCDIYPKLEIEEDRDMIVRIINSDFTIFDIVNIFDLLKFSKYSLDYSFCKDMRADLHTFNTIEESLLYRMYMQCHAIYSQYVEDYKAYLHYPERYAEYKHAEQYAKYAKRLLWHTPFRMSNLKILPIMTPKGYFTLFLDEELTEIDTKDFLSESDPEDLSKKNEYFVIKQLKKIFDKYPKNILSPSKLLDCLSDTSHTTKEEFVLKLSDEEVNSLFIL